MIIPRDIVDFIFEHARRESPIEACGCLAGVDGRVLKHYPMANAEGRADHFTFDPKEQFAVYKAARNEGLRIIGIYHSHPATPARPSDEDIRLAYDDTVVYVIASLADSRETIRGFIINEGNVEEEPLIIGEAPHER